MYVYTRNNATEIDSGESITVKVTSSSDDAGVT